MSEEVRSENAEVEQELPKIENVEDFARVIQALVFASPDVVNLKRIREIVGMSVTPQMVSEALSKANASLESINSPFEIVEQAGGYRFRTKVKYYPWVRELFPEMNARRLSQAALETLAVVAYQQPITRASIENVRGVSCDAPLRSLLEKKFIALGPRAETVGNPYTYVTTPEFMKYFGINRIPEDLPRLREFDELISSGLLVPQYARSEAIEAVKEEETKEQIDFLAGDV